MNTPIWYVSRTPNPWEDNYEKPIYFPKAGWFMKHCQWFVIRYCYLIIIFRELIERIKMRKTQRQLDAINEWLVGLQKRIVELSNEHRDIDVLRQQVQCGITAHDWKFECRAYNINLHAELAMFRCKKCGLAIRRKLTAKEISALKVLNK